MRALGSPTQERYLVVLAPVNAAPSEESSNLVLNRSVKFFRVKEYSNTRDPLRLSLICCNESNTDSAVRLRWKGAAASLVEPTLTAWSGTVASAFISAMTSAYNTTVVAGGATNTQLTLTPANAQYVQLIALINEGGGNVQVELITDVELEEIT